MSTIKLTSDGKVVLVDGKPSCACCCPAGAPTFQWDSVSASKTKCGFDEFVTPSSPPKKYLTKTQAGAFSYISEQSWCEDVGLCAAGAVYSRNEVEAEITGAGTVLYDPSTCSLSGSFGMRSRERQSQVNDQYVDCTLVVGSWSDWSPDDYYIRSLLGVYLNGYDHGSCCASVQTPTSLTQTGIPCREVSCPGGPRVTEAWTGSFSLTLSDEYTTASLIAAAVAALAAFDADWGDTAGSYRNLETDELSLSLRHGKARIPLAGLSLTVGRIYRAFYIPRFTPLIGAVVDGAEAYIEFTFTEGMTTTAEIDVEIPADNGTSTLVGIRWECGPFAP